MYKLSKPFVIRTISPMHVGSGSDLGIVDLPIQREKHTSFPKIEASSLKGSIREALENINNEKKKEILEKLLSEDNIDLDKFNGSIKLLLNYQHTINLVFGYDEDGLDEDVIKKFKDNSEFAGAIGFSDAKILLFPVKSAKGIFAWITSPMVLEEFKKNLELSGIVANLSVPEKLDNNAVVSNESFIAINKNVILEEYSFPVLKEDKQIVTELKKLTGINDITERLVIIDDDSFKDFVNLATEMITRTKIDNTTGTVATRALFNEEYLPAETVLYFTTFTSPIFQKKDLKGIFKVSNNEEELVFKFFRESLPEVIQIGGNATLGKGIVEVREIEGGNNGE